MTAPQTLEYKQCTYVRFSPSVTDPKRQIMAIASSYGTRIIEFHSKPPDVPRPKGKEPPFPSTCTLGSDDRVIIFEQMHQDPPREMNAQEIKQAKEWLQWRWTHRTEQQKPAA